MNTQKLFLLLFLLNIYSNTQEETFSFYLAHAQQQVQKKEYTSALNTYKKALQLRPTDNLTNKHIANELLQLGNTLFDVNPEQAIESYQLILEISPYIHQVYHNIGFTLTERLGEYKESLPWYQKAITLKPDEAGTHFCYALSLLATGNLPEGFAHYEWRWARPLDTRPRRSFSMNLPKQWRGENLHNKTIALRVEQGLGDTFHFIRFAKELKKRGAYIIVEVQKPLVTILSLCDYLDEVIPIGTRLPNFDYQIPMLSTPTVLKTTLKTIPNEIPYLQADEKLVTHWEKILKKDTKFKIGICWYGDKVHGQIKFMPLSFFTELFTIPNTRFYSLQFGYDTDQLAVIENNTIQTFDHDFDNTHGRFMDTAAVMKNLDLIITVDTSLAHLAGGLGVPTWVVLPFPAEWRWLQDRKDSPWYPTMKLFRQTQRGKWENVIEEIKNELKNMVEDFKQDPSTSSGRTE